MAATSRDQMRTGYVAFFDVLGFSALIGRDQSRRVDQYLASLREVFDSEAASPVDYVVFSDSIILTTLNDELPAFEALISRCSTLLGIMLAREIPLRGAISHGPYVTEKTARGTFVAGRAIIEAYQFEGAQDWIGAMLTPSVVQAIPDLEGRCSPIVTNASEYAWFKEHLAYSAFVQKCDRIPFRGGAQTPNFYEGFAVVPSSGDMDLDALRESLLNSIKRLIWLKSLAPDPRSQEKYDQAIFWLNDVYARWGTVTLWIKHHPKDVYESAIPPPRCV